MGADESSPTIPPTARASSDVREVIPPQVAPYTSSDIELIDSKATAPIAYQDPDSRERMVMWHRACEYHEHEIGEGKEARIDELPSHFIEVPPPRDLPPAPFEEPITFARTEPDTSTSDKQKKKKKKKLKHWNGVPLPEWKVLLARSARKHDSSDSDSEWLPSEEEETEEEDSLSGIEDDYEQLTKLTPSDEMKMIRKRLRGNAQPRPCVQEELMYEWHPATCAEYAAVRKIPRVATTAQMRYHYEKYNERKEERRAKIPRFWERKPWDTDDEIMSDDESNKLQARIQGLIERDSMFLERSCLRMDEPGRANVIYFGRFNAERRMMLVTEESGQKLHECSEESEENEELETHQTKVHYQPSPLRMKTRRTTFRTHR